MSFRFAVVVLVVGASIVARPVFASTTDGTIDGASKYAWSENVGWINGGTREGNIHVTDSGLTGYAWGENVGWISFSCSNSSSCGTVNYGVANDGGTLSGYAWGENIGWIHFAPTGGGVTIDASGVFSGYAWGENIGWVVFNCATTSSCATVDFKIATDWRPASARTATTTTTTTTSYGVGGGGIPEWVFGDAPSTVVAPIPSVEPGVVPPPVSPATPTLPAPAPGAAPSSVPLVPTVPVPTLIPEPAEPPPPPSVAERLASLIAPLLPAFPVHPHIPLPPSFITDLPTAIALALPTFTPPLPLPTSPPGALPSSIALALPQFKEPSFPPPASIASPRLEEIPAEAPPALAGVWEPLSTEPVTAFLFAPLPREFTALTKSFPSLGESFTEAGIVTFADVGKIATAELSLPGLTAAVGLPTVTTVPGRYSIPRGIPIAELPHVQRQTIPFNVVFLRGGGELVDLPIGITLTDEGKPKLQAAVVAGQTVQLVLHPQERVERVKGYMVYRKKRVPVTLQPVPYQSIAASLLFATPVFAHPQTEPVEMVEELVLVEFEYTDPDGDGVYTAEVSLPVVAGEYEIITVMDYEDPSLGAKEVRLTTVVDPEGYVFERIGGREARIAGAQVMIERWSDQRGVFEPWPAGIYRQENPQTTDGSGTYSFLVPAGQYRLYAVARGYRPYTSERFDVQAGSGIHRNIALARIWWNIPTVDTKTVLLVVLILLVLYNFYKDYRRERRQRAASPPAAS